MARDPDQDKAVTTDGWMYGWMKDDTVVLCYKRKDSYVSTIRLIKSKLHDYT